MPVGRRFHYQLGGKGFILARAEDGGRSWYRTGRSDTPGQRSQTDAEYGVLPDELDHPEVWNDWSGGFGHAYRETGQPTYHWGENFDGRFPRQLIHCQNTTIPPGGNNNHQNTSRIMPFPPANVGTQNWASLARQWRLFTAAERGHILYAYDSTGSPYVWTAETMANDHNGSIARRPVLCASGIFLSTILSGNIPYVSLVGFAGADEATWNFPYGDMASDGDRTWISILASGNFRPALRSIVGDPTVTANLSATLLVGEILSQVNDLVAFDGQLLVGMSDGLYIGDQSGTFVNVTPSMSQASHPDNFRDLMPWADGVLAQTSQGLIHYRSGGLSAVVQEIPLPSGRSPVRGYIRTLGHAGQWVYAGLYTGSGSYLLATNDIPAAGSAPRWHTLQHWPGWRANRIFFDGATSASLPTESIPQRMWVAMMPPDFTTTQPLVSWKVPSNDYNPLAPQPVFSPHYIASARIDLGAVDWDAPGTPKIFRSVEVWADSLLSGYRYGDIYYDVDQSGSFTLLGRANTSPKSTIYFPTGEGSFTTGQSIELRLASTSASPAFTPVYRSIVLRGALQPRSVDMITAVTRIADGLRDMQGAPMRSAATMLQELRDFGNPDSQGLQAHQLIDLAGATQWVKVLGRIEEREVWQQGEENPEIAATVRMAVLTFS